MSQPQSLPIEKRPRHYAAEIIALPTAEREAAFARVPTHLRQWVRDLVADHAMRTAPPPRAQTAARAALDQTRRALR